MQTFGENQRHDFRFSSFVREYTHELVRSTAERVREKNVVVVIFVRRSTRSRSSASVNITRRVAPFGPANQTVRVASHHDRDVLRRGHSAQRFENLRARIIFGEENRPRRVKRSASGRESDEDCAKLWVFKRERIRETERVFLQRNRRRVQSREQEEQRAATNALGSVDVERNVDEESEHDRSEHAHHGVGEFLLHWVCGRESAVSVDAKVSIDVTTRDRFAEFRRDVRVVFVVVLFEFFRPRWGVRFSSREQHVERHATDETDVDDGDGYREGV